MTVSEKGIETKKYWDVSYTEEPCDFEEAIEKTEESLKQSVKRRLISDVPLGCFLSGGIDSGLITAFAAQESSEPIKTFSVGFTNSDKNNDERPLAKLVSKMYGTDHTEIEVDPNAADIFPELLWHYGEPFADLSALPTYQISKAAREHITVALSGDGGDESFCGYANIPVAYYAEKTKKILPSFAINMLEGICHTNFINSRLASSKKLGRFLSQYVKRPLHEHYDMVNHCNILWKDQLYNDSAKKNIKNDSHLEFIKNLQNTINSSYANKHLYTDIHCRLPGDYLTKVDIASNFVSLEIRSPFLDYELVETAASIPLHHKMKNGKQKHLLRTLAAKHLPATIINQPKRGFGASWKNWLQIDWADMIRNIICDKLAKRDFIFNSKALLQLVDEHTSGRKDHTTRLWELVCLELWIEMFIDKTLNKGDKL
jgi:asparagine synthase (glutamine-hydrolysing)